MHRINTFYRVQNDRQSHAGNGWVFGAPNGGWEYPAFLAIAAIVVGLLSDGKYALTGSRCS